MSHDREHGSRGSRRKKVSELAQAFASALLSGDEIAAESTIRDAMDASLATSEIDEQLIATALWRVGELWERGEITVADEHIATEISLRVVALQREAQRVADARLRRRVMLAAPAGELHVVALRMVANLVRAAGYETIMLGPDVPADALAAAARHHEPDVICLTATMPGPDRLLSSIDAVRAQRPSTGFVIGGRDPVAEEHMRSQIRVCRRVSEAVEAVDAIVQRASQN
jgi:MerR family transcriptional regulator, light-induced transcriptional regulator